MPQGILVLVLVWFFYGLVFQESVAWGFLTDAVPLFLTQAPPHIVPHTAPRCDAREQFERIAFHLRRRAPELGMTGS